MAKKKPILTSSTVQLCGNCMQELQPNWKVCPYCGTKINWDIIESKKKGNHK
jgi:uncharacterized OB-fold protein